MKRSRALILIGSAVCWLKGGLSTVAAPDLGEAWRLMADSQFGEAQAALGEAGSSSPRERELAGVVLIMARPPVPEGRMAELEKTLTGITGADEIAAEALYLRARLHQVCGTRPDHAGATALYLELAERFPASHWAQLGLVKLGLIRLYSLAEPADPRLRLTQVARLLEGIQEPSLRRDLQLQIGWAGLFYGCPLDDVIPHLVAADRVGGLLGITAEDLVLQIGELSLRAGHREQARIYFERFLREFPTTVRRYNVRQRLAELEALSPRGPGDGS